MERRVLIVATNIGQYEKSDKKTGLWLGELTHFYDYFEKMGFKQDIVSPLGGKCPIEPRAFASKRPFIDKTIFNRLNDKQFMSLLDDTKSPSDVNWEDYDAIYYTGGHGVMWDFKDCKSLQEITKNLYENRRVVASVCHGYCGLLNVKLSNGDFLVKGKKLTGFSYIEEFISGVWNLVPYNVEKEMKSRGAVYTKSFPMLPNVVVDRKLVTGQNPNSASLVAKETLRAITY